MIGAFFTVWTIQRTPDIATLKALGATTGSLVRDALGQALIVLIAGVTVGIGLTAVAGSLIGDAMPFVLDASTTVVPAVALIGSVCSARPLHFDSSRPPIHSQHWGAHDDHDNRHHSSRHPERRSDVSRWAIAGDGAGRRVSATAPRRDRRDHRASGSGKSSLLAVASTLIRPDSGHVYLRTPEGSTDIAALSRRAASELRRSSIGIVFQQSNLVSSLTALEQLEVMAHLGSPCSRHGPVARP